MLIIWLALFLLILIGFLSVGIDLAKLATTQSQLQAAADAAALAGATAIDSLTGNMIQAEATARAMNAAANNKAYELVPTPVMLGAGDVTFPSDSTIQVVASRVGDSGMITHFVGAFLGSGFHKLDMQASATAEVRRAGSVCCNMIPVSGIPPAASNFMTGCPYQYNLRLAPGNGISGDYYFLDFPSCPQGACSGNPTGGDQFRCWLQNGYCCCLSVGQVLTPEPGNMNGPFVQGINFRFDADADVREGICFEQYSGTGQRVVVLPVTTDPVGGRGPVTITGFAKFFIKYRAQGGNDPQLVGEFITGVVPGTGNGPPNSTAYYVHLVH